MKEKILNIYKSNIHRRFDGEYNFYFSLNDFKNLKATPYEFKTPLGNTLRGNFYYYDNYKEGHIVVFDHGMGAGHTAYFREIELLASKGYKVFSYDHTGCMASDGLHSNGFLTSLADLDCCLNALKCDFPNNKFSVIGHSWGGFSTSNIAYYHPDVAHVISLAPFISLEAIVNQTFSGLLSFMRKSVMDLETSYYPDYATSSTIKALENYKGHALIIHSKDDNVLNIKLHFEKLKKVLSYKDNVNFIMVQNKRHNPNYTTDAVKLLASFVKERNNLLKKGLLNKDTNEEFLKKFDWWKITEQDLDIWNMIFDVLNK